ncbi:RrF2 family transcriptional regulator [Mesorhizobium retamae]|uniref:Rrf2 family transcriptional regulator n=1 Tax=Mesorhizobium retamae TaxID=2912854 RepID=A0ABS9QPQ8_9HYPH|nr:Rrf2 family transcriptional regulator [Mesorhizobium sp. IRAMC:0171]MCG7509310.1 Rrf2 family transcriptional regulator [Mesorhizobium sp. IRAMC:0171]
MILKSQVEWALHCCAILSSLPEGRFLSTKALAELHGLPKEYLSKALQSLSHAGLVHTTLGPSGGYRLARPPEQLTFLDVVEAVEGEGPTFVCQNIRANNPCRPQGYCESTPCAIARTMWQADEAWRTALRKVTFAELAKTLEQEVSPQIWAGTFEWVLKRAG